jgi:hypothetical protein
MPDIIVIRLHPEEPTTGTQFSSYLTDLKIEAWDVSFTKPKVNVNVDPPIGSAEFDANPSATRIAQHWLPVLVFPPAATATAILEITAPSPEYADADILLRVTRGTKLVGLYEVEYNTAVSSVGSIPSPPDTPPAVSPYDGVGVTGLVIGLPAPELAVDPNDAFVTLPKDGSPPNFDDLKSAVEKVLAQEPGGAVDLTSLSPAQCRHVAYEIAWNRHVAPLPSPSPELEILYTTDAPGFDDKAHQIYQAELMKHRATHDAKAEALAIYIYSLVAALVCEQKSATAAATGFGFPVRPGAVSPTGKVKDAHVVLKN